MIAALIRIIRRLVIGIGFAALIYLAIVAVLTLRQPQGGGAPPFQPPPQARADGNCGTAPGLANAATVNGQSLATLTIAPFGVAETGWQIYEPLIARTIGTGCGGNTGGFADRLRAWQAAHAIAATGRVDPATLNRLALDWLRRRPFNAALRNGCPPSPDGSRLAAARTDEAFGGKAIFARPAALAAYRRMVAAAKQAGLPAPPLLQIASAWRGPDEELARCANGGCGTAARARCSAHRTGLAFDFVLSNTAAADSFSTSATNRLMLGRTPAYRWLVAHAADFGFVNYPFEPWHWEWTGEPI